MTDVFVLPRGRRLIHSMMFVDDARLASRGVSPDASSNRTSSRNVSPGTTVQSLSAKSLPARIVMPDDAKEQLMALVRRHDVPIIEDETYAELYYGPSRPRSLRTFDSTGLVLSCGSFSKTLAPGYRVGWTIPGRFRGIVLHFKLATTVAVAVPTQLAIAEFLASGSFDRHLQKLRRVFQGNVRRWTQEVLDRFPEGTRVSRPMGGFLLWVQLPESVESVELQRSAVRRGLSIAPGPAFSASGQYSNCLRMNASYAWSERTAKAVETAAEIIELSQ